jgi:ribosome maturation factor RimP
MDFNKRVHELLNEALAEQSTLFLVDISIDLASHIRVVLDGDTGVTLEQCMRVSRHIEHNLDREEHDFSLEVGSAGAATPLRLPRQYQKHLGRILNICTESDEQIKGTLAHVDEAQILLQWKAREPKPIGKGKHTVTKEAKLPFTHIKKATVQIQFNK